MIYYAIQMFKNIWDSWRIGEDENGGGGADSIQSRTPSRTDRISTLIVIAMVCR